RLTVPFARHSNKQVMGIDVSPDVIEIAGTHGSALDIQNLAFKPFDGLQLPELPSFDFINSYIVFQHIEPSLGFSLLHQLFERLRKGGIMQVQITYGHNLPHLSYLNFFFRGKFPLYNYIYSLLRSRKWRPE